MRPILLRFLLVVSVVANFALMVMQWRRESATDRATALARSESASLRPERSTTPSAPVSARRRREPWWTQLSPGTPGQLRARLEAAGYPRRLIYNLVIEEVRALQHGNSEQSYAELLAQTPYWRVPSGRRVERDPAESERQSQLWSERMREAFGPTAWFYYEIGGSGKPWSFLPVTKQEQLAALEVDVREMTRAQVREVRDDRSAAVERMQAMQRLKRDELASILTPEEFFEYDLRTSPTQSGLTAQLHAMGLTEAEYRALFPFFREAVDARSVQFSDPTTWRVAQQAMLAELQPEVREVLGEERFADYLQATDPDSERLNRIAERFQLPLSAAAQAATARRDIIDRAEAVRVDRSLAPEMRAAELVRLQREATERIRAALGPRAAEAYLSYDGRWLQQLAPAVPTR